MNDTHANIELLVLLLIVTLVVALVARSVRVPYTLALVLVGLALGFWHIFPTVRLSPDVVLFLFLPILLFEGAWGIEIRRLTRDWPAVFLLAVPGLLIAIGITALFLSLGVGLAWLTALLLGAIISPTDPVAVLALFRQLGLPERLRTIIEGESLFNDGVGAAIVVTLLTVVLSTNQISPWHIGLAALWLMIGGPLIGFGVSMAVVRMLQHLRVDDHLIGTTLTIAVAYGVYILSEVAQTSGLLAVIVAGLTLGNMRRRSNLSQATLNATDDFWEILGYLANSLLFLLVGVQIGAASFVQEIPDIAWAVVGVIVGRAAIVYGLLPLQNLLVRLPKRMRQSPRRRRLAALPARWQPVLLFSGLRGALSLALVLSLPETIPQRALLTSIVYGVVLVTLLGQGIGMYFSLPQWQKGEKEAILAPPSSLIVEEKPETPG
jgi:CPA1 family monovalent cation:H+ antiporter